VAVELFRIDDRLIHGQVVVGWGQPLDLAFIVLVDDAVAESDWEQELYRMGVPPEMEVYFETVEQAAAELERHRADSRPGIVLTGDIGTMSRLVRLAGTIARINLGGIHYKAGRTQKLRYIFLDAAEVAELRALAALGIAVTAQDVPSARPIPLEAVLSGQEAV
jgi:PTS system mannose-specific IIB component/fructoselysine and glucoselysine-specific PTS system IIB component